MKSNNKGKKLLILVAIVGVLVAIGLYVAGYFKPKGAGLVVESDPIASVYVNGEQVGRTPYKAVHEPGELTISLIPDSFDIPLAPFEKKIVLTSGVETVITQNFAESDDLSSGAILSFERTADSDANITVLSNPDSAQVKLDGSIRGFTPHQVSEILEGEHELTISAPGYNELTVPVHVIKGYTLTAIVKLKPLEQMLEPEKEPVAEEPQEEYVEILTTPTNFLRVRSEPDTTGDELTQVSPGERYKVVSKDEESDWYEIEYEEGKSGWVSGEYVKSVEQTEITPTPTETAN